MEKLRQITQPKTCEECPFYKDKGLDHMGRLHGECGIDKSVGTRRPIFSCSVNPELFKQINEINGKMKEGNGSKKPTF